MRSMSVSVNVAGAETIWGKLLLTGADLLP